MDYEIYLEKKGERPRLVFAVELVRGRENIGRDISLQLQKMDFIARHFALPAVKTVPSGALKGGAHFKKLIRVQ